MYPGQNKTCKSDAEIDDFVGGAQLDFPIINEYFDPDDFENPVKNYIHSLYF
jgi:hypothetical protein